MQKKRVLYVSQEIVPYTGETTMGDVASLLPQKTQEIAKRNASFAIKISTHLCRNIGIFNVTQLSGRGFTVYFPVTVANAFPTPTLALVDFRSPFLTSPPSQEAMREKM